VFLADAANFANAYYNPQSNAYRDSDSHPNSDHLSYSHADGV